MSAQHTRSGSPARERRRDRAKAGLEKRLATTSDIDKRTKIQGQLLALRNRGLKDQIRKAQGDVERVQTLEAQLRQPLELKAT
jgi:hypothetical protein